MSGVGVDGCSGSATLSVTDGVTVSWEELHFTQQASHTHIPTNVHTHAHMPVHTHVHSHSRSCAQVHTHMQILTCTHTRTHSHTHVHTQPFHEPPLALSLPLRPGQTTGDWLWPGDLGTVRTGRRSTVTGHKLCQRAWRSGDGIRES